jgi:hypothetical protein
MVEVSRHHLEQGSGINALEAGFADGHGQSGISNRPDEHRCGPGMQADGRRYHCLVNWQRNSFSRTAPSARR